jgi:uncharacterized protein (TIGR03437 family)
MLCMRTVIAIAFAALIAAASAPAQTAPTGTSWQLVWSDEFNGPAGSQPNPANWNYDLGGGGWGNGEAETYTNSPNNASLDGNGNLVIQAIRDSSGNFTSARLQTGAPGAAIQTTDLSWQYGRIEARIKLPFGQGVWPAFWMLGESIATVNWPACGEIDIMENFGTFNNNASVNNGTIHGPTSSSAGAGDYGGGDGIGASVTLPAGETVSNDFHVYALEWSQDSVEFFVDGVSYETRTPADLPSGAPWVFDAPFFILLNLAIGGPNTFLGTPDPNAPFPNQDMVVDYVRVYQAADVPGPVVNTGGVVDAANYGPALTPGSLASIFGTGLSTVTNLSTFDNTTGAFSESASGVQVFVNGAASPLIFLAQDQLNFAIPWDSLVGPPLNVEVLLNGVLSNPVPITLATTAPSLFGTESSTPGDLYGLNIAILTCPTAGLPQPGEYCTLWGNGFGPTTTPLVDGTPAPASPLPWTATPCTLTIGGVEIQPQYCGAAPGEVIYQLNFQYPSGIAASTSNSAIATGTLTINGSTGPLTIQVAPGSM